MDEFVRGKARFSNRRGRPLVEPRAPSSSVAHHAATDTEPPGILTTTYDAAVPNLSHEHALLAAGTVRSQPFACPGNSNCMASCPSMDDSDARLQATRSGGSSVQNATRELQDEMTLIAEALDLAHAILTDLVGRLNEADQEDLSEDLGRLNEIADTIRLHMNHV
jgi:hypothetical protein